MAGCTTCSARFLGALLSLWAVWGVSAGAPRQLPQGNLVLAYATDCAGGGANILEEARRGVNVVVWFATNLVVDSSTGLPRVDFHLDADCIASVAQTLREEGLETAHLISIGGWDAPHPNTSLTGEEWWNVWEKWNKENISRAERGVAGFDGIDWDLEGNDTPSSRWNSFSVDCLKLVGDMSVAAKASGFLVTLVPPESYFDPSTSEFDRSLRHRYPEDWHKDFLYHGRNAYAYFLAKYPPSTWDLVDIQLYESYAHADYYIDQVGIPAADYLVAWTLNLTRGWFVNFQTDREVDLNRTWVSVPPSRLIVGLSFGGKASGRTVYIAPEDVEKAFAKLASPPRGVMFWNIDLDQNGVFNGTARRNYSFAGAFNRFLHTRAATRDVTENETLRGAGARHNIYVGSQFKLSSIENRTFAGYRAIHSKQFSLSTVGNQCKWTATHPHQEEYNLTNCIKSFNYAHGAGQMFRGHNLCWGKDNPDWLQSGNWTREQLRNLLQDHIKTVIAGVKTSGGARPFAWDVVNEACVSNEEYEQTSQTRFFKDNFWYPALPDYVDVAFLAAREADADAQLFYNDFGQSQETGKAEVVYDMVASMLERNIPIDGVGLQQHLDLPSISNVTNFEVHLTYNIERLVSLGLIVHITELDVKCPDPCSAENLQKQAAIYGAALRACLANSPLPGSPPRAPGCKSFETWGFTDADSWLNGARCNPEGPCHPLPWDEHLNPKPALGAMFSDLLQSSRQVKVSNV